ncbi:MAG: prepilin-type N-terminal cleavage/methylation domain-containing protein [Oscillospiraceae bacterium]
MKKKFLKNNRGLTLVELIIGVTIMAIIVAPLLHSFVTSAGTANKSRRAAAATTAAQNLAEQIEAMPSEKFFANAEVLGTGAQFYKSEGAGESLTYTPIGTKPPEDDKEKKHYIGIPNYNEKYDALITLNSEKPINNTKVTIGNPMDAVIDMTMADDNALANYKIEGAGLKASNKFTKEELARAMQISVTKEKNQYAVKAEFTYTATINYTETISTVNDKGETVNTEIKRSKKFEYTDIGTTSVAKPEEGKNSAPLGVYLFFKDIPGIIATPGSAALERRETLTATTKNGAEEFNLFLVDAAAPPMKDTSQNDKTQIIPPISQYLLNVNYKYQKDTGLQRVYANLSPDDVNYCAYKNANYYQRVATNGRLVEKKMQNLLYGINITLFEPNSGFKGTPIVSFDTEKLA